MTGYYRPKALEELLSTPINNEKEEVSIRQVWAYNVMQEFDLIRKHVPEYKFASFDTEFPGSIHGQYRSHASPLDSYTYLRANVDATNIIQLGLTLSNGRGKFMVWEFNFNDFNLTRGDPHNPISVQFLQHHGIDLDKTAKDGINSKNFGELLTLSGLLRNENLTWVGFHSATDFGYLIRILTQRLLPSDVDEFMNLVWYYFGTRTCDLKYMTYCQGLHGGLEKVANALNIHRSAGDSHQAGSDSLLTMQTYMKVMDFFLAHIESEQLYYNFGGVLYGLGIRPVHVQITKVFHNDLNHHGYYRDQVAASESFEPSYSYYCVQSAH
ncbi:hypothetical protein AQUCO_03400297v1 [Aquilegia coerulea]|uniref:poly(A)-specific ribonuclease n=1 Tax=Aquilegia coerulea TaxID=218851 RepID=A0A2G5CYG0_AQUCA|nr:hypothetical protein AQUCO_03400297v1 [Aquilegia coerulea]